MNTSKVDSAHEYFNNAEIFMAAYHKAEKYGLEMEFLSEFLADKTQVEVAYRAGCALGEWDIA